MTHVCGEAPLPAHAAAVISTVAVTHVLRPPPTSHHSHGLP